MKPARSRAAREEDAYEQLLRASLRRGHYKVAVRYALMIESKGLVPDDDLLASCEAAFSKCSATEIQRISRQVLDWVALVGLSGVRQQQRGIALGQLAENVLRILECRDKSTDRALPR